MDDNSAVSTPRSSSSSSSAVKKRVLAIDSMEEHDRWTHPFSASVASLAATNEKQLSYVQRMAHKFEMMAEGKNKHQYDSWLQRTINRSNGDSDDDGNEDSESCMIRSKSLDHIPLNRFESQRSNDSNFHELMNQTVQEEIEDEIANDLECSIEAVNLDHETVTIVESAQGSVVRDKIDISSDEPSVEPVEEIFQTENADNVNGEILDTKNLAFDADDIGQDHFEDAYDSFDSFSDASEDHVIDSVKQLDDTSIRSSNQLFNILQELLENERVYVESLNNGIRNYMKMFDDVNLPNTLRGQKFRLFGNVNRIRDFHEMVFYPALQKCDMDIVAISHTFNEFIQQDYFYGYTLYAINRHRSEQIFEKNRTFLKDYQTKVNDKLGVNSFLVQPIQRLPKYKLLLTQLILELGKNLEEESFKAQIAACCRAEKTLQRLLDNVNESMNINDILECNEINIHHQGKFRKVDDFEVNDNELRRRYKGKVFLFDKCVVYTETFAKHKLFFRGYFRHDTLGFTFEDGKKTFSLYVGKRGHQEIGFNASAATIEQWIGLLNTVLMRTVVIGEKKKIAERHRSRHSKSDLGPVNVLMRLNSPNVSTTSISNTSAWSSGTSSGSGNSRESNLSNLTFSSQSSESVNRTTWYTKLEDEHKTTERLLNAEKYYIQLMSTTCKNYLTNISDETQLKLTTFLDAAKQILTMHTNILYPALQSCDLNVSCICDVFKQNVETKMFHIYNVYAAHVSDALRLLSEYLTAEENAERRDECLQEMEHSLLMPIKHLENYALLMEIFLNEFKEKDFVTEEFKTVATVEIEIKKILKSVTENLNINSLKGSKNSVRSYGLVIYSDTITIDETKYRALILERGLICVKIRISTKTKREKFVEQYFAIPLTATLLMENELYPRRLKISANYAKHISFVMHFATTRKKKQLIEVIRNQQRLD